MNLSVAFTRTFERLLPDRTRAMYICSRLFYRVIPAATRPFLAATVGREWRHFCPVCGDRVPGFSPLPEFYSRQLEEWGSDLRLSDFETCNFRAYQCPHCGAADRDRLCALYLANRLPQTEAQQTQFCLLDIAPAEALSRFIKNKYRIRYRTADLYMKNVDDRVDVTSMSCYADQSFDAFICSHVLEHVDQDSRALAELWRVLKPGGWGILMAPISLKLQETRENPKWTTPGERWKFYGQGDHVRLYSRAGFLRRLTEAGFKVQQLSEEHFKAENMRRCGIAASSVLYVGQKTGPSPGSARTENVP